MTELFRSNSITMATPRFSINTLIIGRILFSQHSPNSTLGFGNRWRICGSPPTSPGVPADLAQHTLTLSYNDPEQVKELFNEMGDQIAAIIVEPIAGHWTFHDLRRSQTSGMAALGVDPVVLDKIQNRVIPGTTMRVYNKHPYTNEKADALALWEAHLLAQLEDKVASLADRRAAS